MSQKVQTSTAVLILFLLSVVAYQSTLRQATDQAREWLRRRSEAFCHPGFRLVNELTWTDEDGSTFHAFVFVSTPLHRGLDPAVQILLEDANHEELDRVEFATHDQLTGSSVIQNYYPRYLELTFATPGVNSTCYCRYYRFIGHTITDSSFPT